MAKIGLSKPYYAVYSATGTTVSYSNGGLLGKYTEMSIEVESGDANILYADNAPAESDKSFAGGTMSITVDDLSTTVLKVIAGASVDSDDWTVFNDSQVAPYLGVGGVIKKKVAGAIKWVAFVLDKVQFDIPTIAAVTQGESIEWQTQELSASILRGDDASHTWFRMLDCDTEADAEAAVKGLLNIT